MHQKKKSRFSAQRAANIILLVFVILFMIFYPYHKTFWGGLIFSFASAGLIGGIADWFAIKSFFAKPLGISWPKALFKTEMIPANREEIITVIVDIVKDKVITKDALTAKIKEIGISKMLIDYIIDHKILNNTAEEIISKINIKSIKKNEEHFRKFAKQSITASKDDIYKIAVHFSDWAVSAGYVNSTISSAASELQKVLKLPLVQNKLDELYTKVKDRYNDSNSMLKIFASNVFSTFSDIPGDLTKMADNYLESIKDPKFISKYDLPALIEQFTKYSAIVSLRKLISNIDIEAIYSEIAADRLENGVPANTIQKIAYNNIDKLNVLLKENGALRKRLIDEMDIRLSDFLYRKIEFIIKNKLAEYSNEMLTEEIYNSVGEDLNMIRLNGSLVGGAVGIFTFIIMYIAG
ncbi:MAG: DUF445 family protein [Bacillota bacterium]|nr:DUF445 family protein [Bacillota bacterium]